MKSKNVFFHPLDAEAAYLEDYEEITQDNQEEYPLRGQTYKFLQPGKFTYLSFSLTYIAFSLDDEDEDQLKVDSVLMYLKENANLLSAMEQTYGPPDLSFEMEGEGIDAEGNIQAGTYSSLTWIQGGHRLSYSLLPGNGTVSENIAQIFIM